METKPEDIKFSWLDFTRAILFFIDNKKFQFIFYITILVSSRFYLLVPTFFIGKIVDFFTTYKLGESLQQFFLYVLILGVLEATVNFIRLQARKHYFFLMADLLYNVKVQGFERLLDFSIHWHDNENTGNKVQRIQSGTMSLRNMMRLLVSDFSIALTSIVGVIIAFLFLDKTFVFLLVFYLIGSYLVLNFFYGRIQGMQYHLNALIEKASGVYYEGLNNLLTIKTLGVKKSFKDNINKNETNTKEFTYTIRSLQVKRWQIFHIYNALFLIIFLFMVGQGVVQKTITIGSIFIFYTYLMRFIDGVANTADVLDDLIEYKSGVARMMHIYWDKMDTEDGKLPFPQLWKTISIKDGTFSYRSEEDPDKIYAITGLNLTIHKHQKVGVVGESGSGKSTLAKLLLGLYRLEKGKFNIGDINFYDIAHAEVTHHIAVVLQESEMFNMSLSENITLLKEVDEKLLQEAIQIAQLEELINKLPEGLETQIGEKGYRVSGGERQRIGIARAICKNSPIMIFDEATSALDSRTESRIQEGLESYLKDKTMVIIAHRVSTLKNVDRIVVFDKGTIVEEGAYHDLLADHHSKFYEVYHVQDNNNNSKQ